MPHQVRLTTGNEHVNVGKPTGEAQARIRANELAGAAVHNDTSREAALFRQTALRGGKATYGDVSIEVVETDEE